VIISWASSNELPADLFSGHANLYQPAKLGLLVGDSRGLAAGWGT
jgi:hypothetical protein